ncbi:MFS transporter [Natronococcus sp. JC468]|uniref:MFS transporter n=1 Tax=Natronococcus sp. JC468 TaxID=1961921 RepID=UPI0028AC4307|nr:MFS transporter [Natronococcus sp. JC468]
MRGGFRETALGGLFVLVASYLLVVPGRRLWGPTIDRVGEFGFLLVLIGVCLACGAGFGALTGIRSLPLLVGGAVVYSVWWLFLEATAGPFDSPVHVLLGTFMLGGFAVGVRLAGTARSRYG